MQRVSNIDLHYAIDDDTRSIFSGKELKAVATLKYKKKLLTVLVSRMRSCLNMESLCDHNDMCADIYD